MTDKSQVEKEKAALDSQKLDGLVKQIGSGGTGGKGLDDHCGVHDIDKVWKVCEWVCPECIKEAANIMAIEKAIAGLDLPPRLAAHTFDTYTPKNAKAQKAKELCIKYAQDREGTGGLIMVGGVGTGKTHLAVAICQEVCQRGVSTNLTTVSRIIREVRSSWGGKSKNNWGDEQTEADIINRYSTGYKLLVIDEIGSQYGSDSEKIIISEIINDRYNNNLPTVIIGNVTVEEAEDYLGERVVDRIKDGGMVVIFDWESHRSLK